MRALPARRIALGALCAALLAGTTGPAAMAADPAPESDRVASSAVLLTQLRHVDAHGSELAPVVDLVNAVLEAPGGQLPRDRAMKLGDAARAAVARAADDDPSTAVTMTSVTTSTSSSSSSSSSEATVPAVTAPATGVLLPQATETAPDPTSDALEAVKEALDNLLDMLLPKDDTATAEESTTDESTTETTDESTAATTDESADTSTDAAPSPVDALLARIDALVQALTGADTQVTTLPAPAAATPSQSTTPATLPALTSLTSLLLPTS
ncbi:hypothetical protein GCM10010297_34420 [Streptomyces malachitofuscus]|nr:hypothetical protein GCM10010297_34420 [Streptomyces malachitofuscus]